MCHLYKNVVQESGVGMHFTADSNDVFIKGWITRFHVEEKPENDVFEQLKLKAKVQRIHIKW